MKQWNGLEVVVQLRSDLHCGTSSLGFISRTLPFVPAHIPFYSLVYTLAKKLKLSEKVIRKLEEFLNGYLLFSPFFIYHNARMLFPWKEEDMLQIEQNYLTSFYGVALDYNTRGALENRLFEKEVIASQPLTQEPNKPVNSTQLRGYVFYRKGSSQLLDIEVHDGPGIADISLNELIRDSQWGGELNKGLGRIQRVQINPTDEFFQGKMLKSDAPTPQIKWPEKVPCPFYLRYDENKEIIGKLIPITGRRYDFTKGPGVKMDKVDIVWNIGWICNREVNLLLNRKTAFLE